MQRGRVRRIKPVVDIPLLQVFIKNDLEDYTFFVPYAGKLTSVYPVGFALEVLDILSAP